MTWCAYKLVRDAKAVSVSRRTDIPAFYAQWFKNRLAAGFAEYIPLGPPRRIRRSLAPEAVTHFNFWSKWPRPFFGALGQVLDTGYPALWNVCITGLGGTDVEPYAPRMNKAVEAAKMLATMVPKAAIAWRYDPVFISSRYDTAHHLEVFERLCDELALHVDRVVVSFVTPYRRQVDPDLRSFCQKTGDLVTTPDVRDRVNVVRQLSAIAASRDLPLAICCDPVVREELVLPRADCNSFDWACRVYPQLKRARKLRRKPCRPDCGCSEEVDIGCYDTCIMGCRYSYGSRNLAIARENHKRHDPEAPCLIP